ncbi:hypothetical protein E4K72_07860 [Oxalobacteraceae bacterium OM1]|nr:hypothetical protein E4K72_07860 [Oxalobacteraceae bacterium OM1]
MQEALVLGEGDAERGVVQDGLVFEQGAAQRGVAAGLVKCADDCGVDDVPRSLARARIAMAPVIFRCKA